jgi:DNA-binding transcriptional regulator LsrR (DeoR family)
VDEWVEVAWDDDAQSRLQVASHLNAVLAGESRLHEVVAVSHGRRMASTAQEFVYDPLDGLIGLDACGHGRPFYW